MRQLLLLAVLAGGCSPEGPIAAVDAATEATTDAGPGVCCPRSASPCAPTSLVGGSAPTLEECPGPTGSNDGVWTDELIDGCPIWIDHGSTFVPGALTCGIRGDAGT